MKWVALSVMGYWRYLQIGLLIVLVGGGVGAVGGWYVTREMNEGVNVVVEEPDVDGKGEKDEGIA